MRPVTVAIGTVDGRPDTSAHGTPLCQDATGMAVLGWCWRVRDEAYPKADVRGQVGGTGLNGRPRLPIQARRFFEVLVGEHAGNHHV